MVDSPLVLLRDTSTYVERCRISEYLVNYSAHRKGEKHHLHVFPLTSCPGGAGNGLADDISLRADSAFPGIQQARIKGVMTSVYAFMRLTVAILVPAVGVFLLSRHG